MRGATNDRLQFRLLISDPGAHQVEAQRDAIWGLCWHKQKCAARAAAQQSEPGTATGRSREQRMAEDSFTQQRPRLHSLRRHLRMPCFAKAVTCCRRLTGGRKLQRQPSTLAVTERSPGACLCSGDEALHSLQSSVQSYSSSNKLGNRSGNWPARVTCSSFVVSFIRSMNLQQLVQAIKDISSRSQDLNQLLQQLKVSEETLKNQRPHLLNALSELDPARHSLGCLFLL